MKGIKAFPVYIIIFFLSLGLSSCEKDRITILTDGVWSFSNITTTSEDETVKTMVAGMKAVYIDGTIQFFSDGTYIKEFALFDDEPGTWTLVGDTQLVLTPDDGVAQTSSIDKIKKDELVLIDTFVDAELNTFNTLTTWKR